MSGQRQKLTRSAGQTGNQLPYLTGQAPKGARTDFAYFNDAGQLVAYRHGDWKAVFCQMVPPGGFAVWATPFQCLRIPKLFNLRMEPYERADVLSDQYDNWRVQNAYLMGWMVFHAASFLETFVEYPPSQEPASSAFPGVRGPPGESSPIDRSARLSGYANDDQGFARRREPIWPLEGLECLLDFRPGGGAVTLAQLIQELHEWRLCLLQIPHGVRQR